MEAAVNVMSEYTLVDFESVVFDVLTNSIIVFPWVSVVNVCVKYPLGSLLYDTDISAPVRFGVDKDDTAYTQSFKRPLLAPVVYVSPNLIVLTFAAVPEKGPPTIYCDAIPYTPFTTNNT